MPGKLRYLRGRRQQSRWHSGSCPRSAIPAGGEGDMSCTHTWNTGLTTAVSHGIHYARGERLIVMDTDFNHSPGNIAQMLGLLGDYDLVIGIALCLRGGGMEDRSRYVFSWLYNLFIRSVLQHGIRDSLEWFLCHSPLGFNVPALRGNFPGIWRIFHPFGICCPSTWVAFVRNPRVL